MGVFLWQPGEVSAKNVLHCCLECYQTVTGNNSKKKISILKYSSCDLQVDTHAYMHTQFSLVQHDIYTLGKAKPISALPHFPEMFPMLPSHPPLPPLPPPPPPPPHTHTHKCWITETKNLPSKQSWSLRLTNQAQQSLCAVCTHLRSSMSFVDDAQEKVSM